MIPLMGITTLVENPLRVGLVILFEITIQNIENAL